MSAALSRLAPALALLLAACGGNTVVADGGVDAPAGDIVAEAAAPICGNNAVEGSEECDDGNLRDGDGCERSCRFTCRTAADCDDRNVCTGAEACNATTHLCSAGAPPAEGAECDADMNAATRDVCRAAVCRPSTCGDGFRDPGRSEVCDDGNGVDRDGCDRDCTFSCATAADCTDTESCNGAETCDAAAHACRAGTLLADGAACGVGGTCSAGSCAPPSCGNGMLDAGEECDDGNTARWDGCSGACRLEQTVRATRVGLLGAGMGCDLTGDGAVDNALGAALTAAAADLVNQELQRSQDNGSTNLLLSFLELDDRLGQDDLRVQLGFFNGVPALPPFTGAVGERFAISGTDLDPSRNPIGLLPSASITGGMVDAGPGIAVLRLNLTGSGLTALTLHRLRFTGTVTPDMAMRRISGVRGGRICGALTASDLDRVPLPDMIPASCRSPVPGASSLLDLLAVGCNIGVPFVNATPPDVDVGSDGIATGMPALQDTDGDHIVDTCRDASTGVVIRGNDCAQDPRFDDAFSAALSADAQRVVISVVR